MGIPDNSLRENGPASDQNDTTNFRLANVFQNIRVA